MEAVNFGDMTVAQIDEELRAAEALLARGLPFSERGFIAHYRAISGWEMLDHVCDWVHTFFERYDAGVRRFLVKAHRGATKSSVFTTMLSSYALAKHPAWPILIVQKGDDAGTKTASGIASIIEDNTGWRMAYPELVPDKEKRWSAAGYEIRDDSASYSTWREQVLRIRPRDPSFIGLGWSSGSIVGMHPMALFIDDIHDAENTRSQREMDGVMESLKSNILQTVSRPPGETEPLVVVSYTPWSLKDCYAYLENTGLYDLIETPLLREDEQGFEYLGSYTPLYGKRVKTTWNVPNPEKYVREKEEEQGPIDFARMQMLDLSATLGKNLKAEWLHEYPRDKLDGNHPVYFGVDYASTLDKLRSDERDYFSVAFIKYVPGVGGVVYDGFRDKISRAEAKDTLISLAIQHNPVLIGIEKYGKGEEFFVDMLSSGCIVRAIPDQGDSRLGKGEKFEGVLAKLFFSSQLWIADVKTPFLKAFENEWISWDGTEKEHDDTLDAVYLGAYLFQHFLHVPRPTANLKPRERKHSAFATLGSRMDRRRA